MAKGNVELWQCNSSKPEVLKKNTKRKNRGLNVRVGEEGRDEVGWRR